MGSIINEIKRERGKENESVNKKKENNNKNKKQEAKPGRGSSLCWF